MTNLEFFCYKSKCEGISKIFAEFSFSIFH